MQKLTTLGKFDQKKRDTCWNALTETPLGDAMTERRAKLEPAAQPWRKEGGFRLVSNRLQNETLESSAIVLASDFFALFAAVALENFLCRSGFLDRRNQKAKGFESKPGRLWCCWSGACAPGSAMKPAGARRRWRPAERGFAMYRK